MCLSSDCDGVELSGRILVSHISLLLDPGTVPSKYVFHLSLFIWQSLRSYFDALILAWGEMSA